MEPGETILGFDFGNHLWIVMSAVRDGRVAVVNLTTFRPPDSDPSCILAPGDHPFVSQTSCVYYRKAELVPVSPLQEARTNGTLRQHAPLSPELLRRVQDGALSSRYTSRVVKAAVLWTLSSARAADS